MSRIDFERLDDDSRTWIFAAAQPLDARQTELVTATVRRFLEEWTSHGEDVPSSAELLHDRFLVIAADESAVSGGCAVDRLFRTVRQLREAGADFLQTTLVFWRDGELVRSATREEFRCLAESGVVGADTIVFDTTVERLGDVRDGSWARTAAESWHAQAFPLRRAS